MPVTVFLLLCLCFGPSSHLLAKFMLKTGKMYTVGTHCFPLRIYQSHLYIGSFTKSMKQMDWHCPICYHYFTKACTEYCMYTPVSHINR
jgi:hypothetical protein